MDHIDTDPPFRTLTLRLLSKMLIDLATPDVPLLPNQLKRLINAYRYSVYQLKRLTNQIDPWEKNILESPYYHLMENLSVNITKFSPIDSH